MEPVAYVFPVFSTLGYGRCSYPGIISERSYGGNAVYGNGVPQAGMPCNELYQQRSGGLTLEEIAGTRLPVQRWIAVSRVPGILPKLFASIPEKQERKHEHGNDENVLSLHTAYTASVEFENLPMQPWRKEMKTEIQEMPEYTVAYVRKIGAYGKETCGQAFDELARWAGPKGHFDRGVVLGVYWDDPKVTSPENCRVDACVSVPPGTVTDAQIGLQVISGGSYAVCGFELDSDGFPQAWNDAFAWLAGSGYECDDRPCYELYRNNGAEHPEGKWFVDICIPLKRR